MIYNGNYDYSTFENIKGDLIEAFVRYYGENHRDQIEEKIGRLEYNPYHPIDYLINYHNNYISQFRDQILSCFFKKIGVRKTDARANAIWRQDQKLGDINILNINVGGFDYGSSDFGDETKNKVAVARQTIAHAFKLPIDSPQELYSTLMDYRKKFDESINEVEQKNACDVFDDMQTIKLNRVGEFKEYLMDVIKTGYGINQSDYDAVNDPNFVYSDIANLKANLVLYANGIADGGYMQSFTTSACNILGSSKTSATEKFSIMFLRLLYLSTLKTTKFVYITKEQLEDFKTTYNDCMTNHLPLDSDMMDIITKEYNYQKDCRPARNPKLHKTTQAELISSWRKGEFVPKDLADEIEDIREFHANNILDGTKYNKIEDFDEYNYGAQYYTQRYFEDNNLFKYKADIIAGEEFYPNLDSYLGVLIHEINHVLSSDNPYEVGNKTFKNRYVVNLVGRQKSNKNNNVGNIVSYSNTNELAEFINESQSQEIKDIFYQIMNEKNLEIPNDQVLDPKDYVFDCSYDYYKIIAQDFYDIFRDILKESAINNNLDIFFKYNLPTNKFQNILDKPKNFVSRLLSKDYYGKTGVMDMHKVEKLNALIQELQNDVLPHIGNMQADDLLDMSKWRDLDTQVKQKLLSLVVRKNKLIEEFMQDIVKKNIYIQTHSDQYQLVDEQETSDQDDMSEFIKHIKDKISIENSNCMQELKNQRELV